MATLDFICRGLLAGRRRAAAATRLPLGLPAVLVSITLLAAAPDGAAQTAADEEFVEPILNQALETEKTGVEVPWSNPATASSGTIVIERTFYRDPRTPCRDYRRTLERPGAPTVEIEGTGCRVGPGQWELDEEEPTSRAATPAPAPSPTEPPGKPPEPEPARAETAPPSCPTIDVAAVPCDKPPPVVDYTMPARTRL